MDKKEYIKKLLELDMQFEIAVKSGKEKLIEIVGEMVSRETGLLLEQMTKGTWMLIRVIDSKNCYSL